MFAIYGYNNKLIVSGDMIESYQYDQRQWVGVKSKGGRKGKEHEFKDNDYDWDYIRSCYPNMSDADWEVKKKNILDGKEKNRALSLRRIRTEIRRTVMTNIKANYPIKPKIVTLTFAENMQDIEKANYEFKKFKQKLERKVKYKLKYTCVIEFQERGAIHYHILFYNLKYFDNKEMEKLWGHGFTEVENVRDIKHMGAYISSYLSKEDDKRLRGHKAYFNSRNLEKSKIIRKEKEVDAYINSLKNKDNINVDVVYSSNYTNDYTGKVNYIQYKIER